MSVETFKYSTIVNVRNIRDDMTNQELKEIFSKYGTVTSCKIMRSGNIECGHFAYVAFEDPDAAEEAIIELNGQELTEGRRIYLRRTGEKLKRQPNIEKKPEITNIASVNRCEIFVKHLDECVDARDLRTWFRCCGTITEAKVIMENNRSKGYGFVSFTTPEAANKAVTTMNGSTLIGQRIHVALATGTDRNKILGNARSELFTRWNERRGDNFGLRWNEQRVDNIGTRWNECRNDNFATRWNERRDNVFGRRGTELQDDNLGVRTKQGRGLDTNPTASTSDEAIDAIDDSLSD